ncbi:Fic family protein [Undibacterium sp. Di26W]|uniref:Fic family protein n=1 Tax=Undibacterium sp. Di26W TaxID=3413035 RepID=UPI003BF2230B
MLSAPNQNRKQALAQAESDFTRIRIAQVIETTQYHPSAVSVFDAEHLKNINASILQDMPMYRGGLLRLNKSEHIRSRTCNGGQDSYVVHYKNSGVNASDINQAIAKLGDITMLQSQPRTVFVDKLAMLYADLDYIHAFNEANSRTLRLFTSQIATMTHHTLDWSKVFDYENPREVLYQARDIAVSKRSFPALDIASMRDASQSEFEAYETQKKLANAKTLAAVMHEIIY